MKDCLTLKSFRELGVFYRRETSENYKALTVKSRSTYLSEAEAVYDFVIGYEHIAIDDVFCGGFVTINDRQVLMEHGFTHVRLRYNTDRYVSIPLDHKRGPGLNPSLRHGKAFG